MVKWLHTKTIAVQGAAPSSTAPARYSRASGSGIHALKITKKNTHAIPNIVKGLISQFTTQVTNSPLGFLPTSRMLWKSTFSIMG